VPRLILLLLFGTAFSIVHADPLLAIKAQPAWNGVLVPGTTTEVAVTLLADSNGTAAVTLPDHAPRLRVTTELLAHQPHTLWLAVRPAAGAPLRITARMSGGATASAAVGFESVPEDARLVASTVNLRDPTSSPTGHDGSILLNPSAGMLPRTPGGYGGITAVILDGDGLAALDDRQLAALQSYAADCGRIAMAGAAGPRFTALTGAAGCGGHDIVRAANAGTALGALHDLPAGGSVLPSANLLQSLAKSDAFTATWSALLLFFILYTVGLLVTARGARRVMPLLLVPVLAACLGWAAWSNDKAARRLISWSEMNVGDHSLRYAALLQIAGDGKGRTGTPLPAGFGLFQPRTTDAAELDRRDGGSSPVTLRSDNYLLARMSYYTRGDLSVDPAVHVSLAGGAPRVENRGASATPPALLGWNDKRYPVPSLRPGEHWSPPVQGTPWNVARMEEQWLRSRTRAGTPAVLMPHRLLTTGGAQSIEERGWLLIVAG
jgi:hypothetical protein